MSEDGRTVGPYRILAELGRGGQGTVYLAEDTRLKRRVALKVLNAAVVQLPEERLLRFRREAEAASRLDHPHICPIYEAGEAQGVPYIAMRYVEGRTLAEHVEQAQQARVSGKEGSDLTGKQGMQFVITLVERVARALHYAHEHGLVHRDVKPGNVMVTAEGEPVILDFGMARDELTGGDTLTHSGDLLGTPAYMSPEQLLAQRVPLDRRTDVYSLGATLYECLNLERPFSAPTRAELYQQILHADPDRVSSTRMPRELRVVLQTAMEKDRNRRYQTALDLAEDLRRVRSFEPVLARPIGRLLRLKRWSQRHPVTATVLSAAALLAAAGLAGSLAFIRHQEEQLRKTRALALASASREVAPNNPELALRLALAGVALDPGRDTLSPLHSALSVQHARAVVPIGKTAAWPTAVDVSPDGLRFVTGDHEGSSLRLFDLDGKQLWVRSGHTANVMAAVFSPDGAQVLSVSADGKAKLWDLQGNVLREFKGHDEQVSCGAFSADFDWAKGRGRVFTGGKDKTARIWSPGGECVRVLDHGGPVRSIASSPACVREGLLLTGSQDGLARVWRVDGGKPVEVDAGGSDVTVSFSPRGDRVLAWSVDNVSEARLWDLQGVRQKLRGPGVGIAGAAFSRDGERVLTTHWDQLVGLHDASGLVVSFPGDSVPRIPCFSRDGRQLLVPYHDQTVRLHNHQGHELVRFAGHTGRVRWARFMDGERVVISGSEDGTVRLWDVQARGFPVLWGHTMSVQRLRFSKDGRRLLSAGEDGRVLEWDLDTGACTEISGLGIHVSTAEYSPDGESVVTASSDQHVRLWTRQGILTRPFPAPEARNPFCAVFSPHGSVLLTCWGDGTSRLSDLAGNELVSFKSSSIRAWRAAFSPHFEQDGRVLTASEDGNAYVWYRDGRKGPVLHHGKSVGSANFSRDGKRMLTAGYDNQVRLWDLEGRELWCFKGHEGPVHTAEFSQQGDLIVTASRDKTVRILDPESRERLAIDCRGGFCLSATFSPDGRRVAFATGATIRLAPVHAEDLLELARARAGAFTEQERERFADLLSGSSPADDRPR